MRLLLLLAACDKAPPDSAAAAPPPPWPDPTCEGPLFGAPNATTGLEEADCAAFVEGADLRWTPTLLSADDLAALRGAVLLDTLVLESDPYEGPAPEAADAERVCGVVIEESGYRLVTFEDPDAARAAGAFVSHGGPCGLCSTLTDLAVYAEQPDLTAPVRACGLASLGDVEATAACIAALGFTAPCAQVWAYNVRHTQSACGAVCLSLLDAPYHEADGSLNDCLACDEAESGPVFKAVAGRTRRNTGLANALCRPCEEVWRIDHAPLLAALP
jgi:hypothetical protein